MQILTSIIYSGRKNCLREKYIANNIEKMYRELPLSAVKQIVRQNQSPYMISCRQSNSAMDNLQQISFIFRFGIQSDEAKCKIQFFHIRRKKLYVAQQILESTIEVKVFSRAQITPEGTYVGLIYLIHIHVLSTIMSFHAFLKDAMHQNTILL